MASDRVCQIANPLSNILRSGTLSFWFCGVPVVVLSHHKFILSWIGHRIHGCEEYRLSSFFCIFSPPAVDPEWIMECKSREQPKCKKYPIHSRVALDSTHVEKVAFGVHAILNSFLVTSSADSLSTFESFFRCVRVIKTKRGNNLLHSLAPSFFEDGLDVVAVGSSASRY